MLNKDFLKEVFADKKRLLKLKEVKWINVPLYDELSVAKLWPLMQDDTNFMLYMPSKLPKGRSPDRTYFFNIMNTLYENYVASIIEHANKQRNTISN